VTALAEVRRLTLQETNLRITALGLTETEACGVLPHLAVCHPGILAETLRDYLGGAGSASGGVPAGDRDFPGQLVGNGTVAEQRPDTLAKVVKGLIQGVTHTVGAEFSWQADGADTP
jgi:hypothetical protein